MSVRTTEASVRVYQALLWVYPADYRREYGPWMVQLFRDLLCEAHWRRGVWGVVALWMRVLWDIVSTAPDEHLGGGLPGVAATQESPLPWWQVMLAVLPGTWLLCERMGLLQGALGHRASVAVTQLGLTALCVLLVLTGWTRSGRRMAWAYPALGLLFWLVPGAAMDLLFGRSRSLSPVHTWLVNAELFAAGALGVVLLARFHRCLRVSTWAWVFIVLTVVSGPFFVPFQVAMLLLPLAVSLLLARREGVLALLVTTAAQFSIVDRVFDPSYGMLIWSSSSGAKQVVEVLPVLAFLILAPLWSCRARSWRGRVAGQLLPPLAGLLSGEIIRALVIGGQRPYSPGMWYARGGGALHFVALLGLAACLCLSLDRREKPVAVPS